jgi:hypothetical protein
MEEEFTAALNVSAELAAVFGERIHWDEVPAGKPLPALCIHDLSSAEIDYTLKGRTATTGWRLQLDCWAATARQAIAGRTALLATLDRINEAPLQVVVERLHGGSDRVAGPAADRTTTLRRRSLDVLVWHATATA